MNFKELDNEELGYIVNPFAGVTTDGEYIAGGTSVAFLNENFGQYENANEMIEATNDEGFKLFFAWLRDEGNLN